MSEFDDDGWAEVIVKKKVKAQVKAEIIKQEDAIVAQDNKQKLQEMKELYKSKTTDKKPINTVKDTAKRAPTTPTKKAGKPEAKAPVVAQKPKYKDIEHAFRSVNVPDFQNTLESVRINFNANHFIQLRAVISYLNEHLRVSFDDPTYSGKSIFYPYDVTPAGVRNDILTVIRNAGVANYQYFFDMCLTNLADDMNKGLKYLGYKVVLQLIAREMPAVCINSLARSAMLRNSYQNKPQIGLTILWALGQGGFHDLDVGLKVWQNLMVPVLDSKHYSSFVGDYSYKVLRNYSSNSNIYKINITDDQFSTVYTLLTTTKKIPKQLLDKIILLYMEVYARNVANPQKVFLSLLETVDDFKDPDSVRHGLLWLINRDINSLTVWKLNYTRLTEESVELLHYMDKNLKTLTNAVVKSSSFREFLNEVGELNKTNRKDEDDQSDSTATLIKQLQEKSKTKNKGGKNAGKSSGCSSCCKWTFGILVLLGAIAGALIYDTNTHGGKFEASATGKFLKDIGALPYVQTGWTVSMKYSARGYVWAEDNLPVYYGKTRVALEPYVDLSKDLSKIAWSGAGKVWNNTKEIVNSKTPLVTDFIEQYAPGLPKKISEFTSAACEFVSTTSVKLYHGSCEFFRTKVLVGKLSPENLGKVMNCTQNTAASYYSRFHEQVEYYAQLK